MRARAGHAVVSTSFYFDYKGDPKNRAVVLARLARVKPCIENFYCRFGFSLQLRFTVNSGLKEWLESDRSISLWDVYARSNYINWIMLQTNAGDLTEDVACSMAAHEVGHALGLLDAYSDEDCPDRPHLKADNNLMANVFKSPKDLNLDRSQVRSILEPLCSEK